MNLQHKYDDDLKWNSENPRITNKERWRRQSRILEDRSEAFRIVALLCEHLVCPLCGRRPVYTTWGLWICPHRGFEVGDWFPVEVGPASRICVEGILPPHDLPTVP